MLKLLLMLIFTMLLATALLQLRQQRLELNFQTNQLHNAIRDSQSELWSQQIRIAVFTAPNAISETVGDQKLKMGPQSPISNGRSVWLDPASDPSAE
jgi:cell division protein FtsL